MRAAFGVSTLAFLLVVPLAYSQTIEVNRQNRTIEVIATESVRVDPDVANFTVGCLAYGRTHDQAYQANLAIADKVIKALLGAGISKDQIESSSIELSETNSGDLSDQSTAVKKVRQFKAHQNWRVRVAAAEAQKLIDTAVQAGANGVEEVSWDVTDPEALEAKARGPALEKARTTAAELVNTATASLGSPGNGFPTPVFSLQLFPEKITRQATVRAIFALD